MEIDAYEMREESETEIAIALFVPVLASNSGLPSGAASSNRGKSPQQYHGTAALRPHVTRISEK